MSEQCSKMLNFLENKPALSFLFLEVDVQKLAVVPL